MSTRVSSQSINKQNEKPLHTQLGYQHRRPESPGSAMESWDEKLWKYVEALSVETFEH
jgi:hypothetical protein